jgi:uncharacterized protein
MYCDAAALRPLPRDECLALMASAPVGRIIYTRQALPAVELVNFALDRGDIVIRTDHSGKLAAATRGAVVAFETDSVDPGHQAGWSVTAIGRSHEVTDPDEIARLTRIGLSSWAPGDRNHFIRISPEILTGRRLSAYGAAPLSPDPGPMPRSKVPSTADLQPTGLARMEGENAMYIRASDNSSDRLPP